MHASSQRAHRQGTGEKGSLWRRWLYHPQAILFRKSLFQIHLWLGIGVGLYVLAISLSGSAIVYRSELARIFSRRVAVAAEGRPRLSADEIETRIRRAYPAYDVLEINEPERPDLPDRVELAFGRSRIERLFDPYTGDDLGNPESVVECSLDWLVNFHDNLLFSQTGRLVNGFGSLLLTVISLTGVVLWWPGVKNWRRGTTVNWEANFARFNWDLHSAIGFWCSLFVFVWGVSGIYLCFYGALELLPGGAIRFWITQLHFGRFNGLTQLVWTLVGLAPAALAVTGALMWWNRSLRKKLRRWTHTNTKAHKTAAENATAPGKPGAAATKP